MVGKQKFQVAIVSESLAEAKMLSQVLREFDVVPYVYQSLKKYIQSTQKEVPHLSLVSVSKTSEGELSLADHPKYKSGVLKVAIYCDNSTIPLMAASYDYQSLGFFNIETENIKKRISNLIQTAKQRDVVMQANIQLRKELHILRERNEKLMSSLQVEKQREEYDSVLKSFTAQLDNHSTQFDFYQALQIVFDQSEWVREFSIVEATINGQKLISPMVKSPKFRNCPSLWLGREHGVDGIKQYAQNLSHQVMQDYMSSDFITLAIRVSGQDNPHALLYLDVDPDFKQLFNWQLFQSVLSGFYCRSLLGDKLRVSHNSSHLSEWEFFDMLESNDSGPLKRNKLYVLDFDRLFSAIEDQDGEFYWRNFYEQFTTQLSAKVETEFHYSVIHSSFMAILIPLTDASEFEAVLTSFYKKFSYWRYFVDPDNVLAKDLSPRIRILMPDYQQLCAYIGKKQNEQWQGRRREQLEDLIDQLHEVRRPSSEI